MSGYSFVYNYMTFTFIYVNICFCLLIFLLSAGGNLYELEKKHPFCNVLKLFFFLYINVFNKKNYKDSKIHGLETF